MLRAPSAGGPFAEVSLMINIWTLNRRAWRDPDAAIPYGAHAFKIRGIREKFELSSQGTWREAVTKIKPRVLLIDILSKNKKTVAQFARIQIGQLIF